MANVIKLKRGTSTPTSSDIVDGEVAIDKSAQKFYVNDGGTVKEIGGGGFDQDSQGNLVAGTNAGDSFSGTDAEDNILIGENAGTAIDTGDRNIAIGTDAIKINSGQSDNVAVGHEALKNVTRFPSSGGAFAWFGQGNVAIGSQALLGGTAMTGYNNVATGYQALKSNTEGFQCVAVGAFALENNIASRNTACGYNSLKSLSVNYAQKNTAIGEGSGQSATGGNGNLFAGYFAGYNVTSGTNNVLLGHNAGNSGTNNLTTGSNNIILGYQAAASSATVSNEVTIGDTNISKFRVPGINFELTDGIITLKNGGTRSEVRWYCESSNAHYASIKAPAHADFSGDLTFVLPSGYGSSGQFLQSDGSGGTTWAAASGGGLSSDSQNNTLGGTNAGDSFSGTDATNNTLIGYNAGTDITTADNITALGSEAAANVTTGNNTTAVGYEACKATKDSYDNTGIGYQALKSADNAGGEHTFYGSWNVAVGSNAVKSLTVGRGNTGIGTDALKNATTPNYNTAVGRVALEQCTTGVENTCVGAEAGQYITTGQQNTMIGYRTLFAVSGTFLTGNNNTCLGYKAKPSAGNVSNEVTIGNTDVTKFRVPGINFVVKDSTATEGHVLTVDSNGECGFAEASGGGPTGGGSDKIFTENGQTVTTNYTIGDTFGAACNAMAAGPITINSGITVTVDSGDTLTIV